MKWFMWGRTWYLGVFPMWRFSVTNHEYWRRYCFGCVYVLRWHKTTPWWGEGDFE